MGQLNTGIIIRFMGKSPNVKYGDALPLDHFGYDKSHSFGANYEEHYFLLSEPGRGSIGICIQSSLINGGLSTRTFKC